MDNSEFSSEKSLYGIIFEDESYFEGGALEFPKWSKIPDKKIKSLELFLPNGKDVIKLENYESYNFLVGARKPLNSQEVVLAHMYGLGHRGGIVTSYRITLVSSGGNKYKAGDITVRKFPFGKEGIRRTATTGWKSGVRK